MVKRKQIAFLNFILLQVFLSSFIGLSYLNLYKLGWKIRPYFIFGAIFVMGFLCIWTVKELLRLVKRDYEAEIALARLEENRALIRALRMKQHDFANHLQVIFGLVDLGKIDKVKEYVRSISSELMVLDRLTSLKRPELAALISKKMTSSNSAKIEPCVETDLSFLEVPADKLVSILGNLLDNAIYQEENYPTREDICLKIFEEDGRYVFEVWNQGYIEPGLQEQIFQPGFSTKGEDGSGMGLHIVSKLVSQYGGNLDLVSDIDQGTTFRVAFPISINRLELDENAEKSA